MKEMKKIIAVLLIISTVTCFAAQTETKTTGITFTAFQNLPENLQKQIAEEWQLTPEEYQKYLYYINFTPDKTTYDANTTNPLWILAAHAKDKKSYDEYIKKAVIIEHDEVGRMLQVGHDFSQTAKKLYPHEYPVMPPWLITNQLQAGDVVQLFCIINDQTSSNILNEILPMVRKTFGAELDVFAIGKITTSDIINFGIRNKISKAETENKKITLNFGNQAFDLLKSEAKKNLPLPFIIVRRNGQEIPVNLKEGVSND